MPYILGQYLIGNNHRVDIDYDCYESLRHSTEVVKIIFSIVNKFTFICDNYLDFESVLLDIGLRNSMFDNYDWSVANLYRNRVARGLTNLLSSCRMYLDHTDHELKSLGSMSEKCRSVFNDSRSEYYDKQFSYRFMERLRNWSQHRGDPVYGISPGWARLEIEGKTYADFRVQVYTNMHEIKQDNNNTFPDGLLEEAFTKTVNDSDNLELRPILREYISTLYAVQAGLWDCLEVHFQEASEDIHKSRDFYLSKFPSANRSAIVAAETDDRGIFKNYFYLFTKSIEETKKLQTRYRKIKNADVIFVSNATFNTNPLYNDTFR